MADRSAYPDVEVALVDLLGDLASGGAGTVTPPDLQDSMPFLRIKRFGGTDDLWTDAALVSVDAFASTRTAAFDLAESVRQRLLTFPHVTAEGTIDRTTTATGPNEVGWSDDQTVRRFTASYRVTVRR